MAGSAALQDILGWVALTKSVVAVRDGIPNPFPSWLYSVRGEDRVIGNSVKFNRTYGTRKTARVVEYGAPPRDRNLQQEELVETKFISFSEKIAFEPQWLALLRQYDSWDNADKAKRLVANNVQVMGTRFANSRTVMVATTLAKGAIYVDVNGNLLPTSSGAVKTFSQQISANNIGTVLDSNSAGIFGATGGGSWANASTDIPLQLRRLKEHALMQHGYEPMIALYGRNVPSYLQQNDYVLDYMSRTPGMQSVNLKDNTIPDLFDFQWVPAWKASYTKDDDTKVSLWPSDGVTFLPAQSESSAYWSMFEGSNEVPTNINIQTDVMAALSSTKTVFGTFGYSRVTDIPVNVVMVMGDTCLCAVKLPDVVYIADVVA